MLILELSTKAKGWDMLIGSNEFHSQGLGVVYKPTQAPGLRRKRRVPLCRACHGPGWRKVGVCSNLCHWWNSLDLVNLVSRRRGQETVPMSMQEVPNPANSPELLRGGIFGEPCPRQQLAAEPGSPPSRAGVGRGLAPHPSQAWLRGPPQRWSTLARSL